MPRGRNSHYGAGSHAIRRPATGRNAHQALDVIRQQLQSGQREVYDADLKSYFDTIPHDQLMAAVRMRIVDRSVLNLIRMWLESPVVEQDESGRKTVHRTTQGTPQGGVISPLLANIYLHWFEKRFHAPDGPATWANAKLVPQPSLPERVPVEKGPGAAARQAA